MPKKRKTCGGPKPADDEHSKRLENVSAENAKLPNETPLTQEQAEDISKRSI
jgi:hypothetical protein